MLDSFRCYSAAVLEECSFDFGYCGWNSVDEKDNWKLSSKKAFIKYPGKLKRETLIVALAWTFNLSKKMVLLT